LQETSWFEVPGFVLLAQMACGDIPLHFLSHRRPPVMAGYELQGFANTLVSGVWAVMHFLKEEGSQPKCIGYGIFAVV
jgi:hypothetical protein